MSPGESSVGLLGLGDRDSKSAVRSLECMPEKSGVCMPEKPGVHA